MDSSDRNISYEDADTLASLRFSPRTLEFMNSLWALVFNTLSSLEAWGNAIEDILAKYEKDETITKFDNLFSIFLQNWDVLNYSDEEWYAFYMTMCATTSLAEHIAIFKKWVFAKSFVAEMYSFSAPAFSHLSESERKSYSQPQKKYAPIDVTQLAIVTQIFDKLIEVQKWRREEIYPSLNLN